MICADRFSNVMQKPALTAQNCSDCLQFIPSCKLWSPFFDLAAAYRGLVVCDNLGALNKACEKRKKIPAVAKHADIRRCLRMAHSKLTGSLSYQHVYGHQDKKKKWRQLTVLEKLNCKCDTLAKLAVDKGTCERPHFTRKAKSSL